MKTEDHAWRALQTHASAQLRTGFADRVLRSARGPQAETWRELQARAAANLRPGFAERVLRAARAAAEAPSLAGYFTLSAVTAAACLGAVVFIHDRNIRAMDERNLAQWEQIVSVAQDYDSISL